MSIPNNKTPGSEMAALKEVQKAYQQKPAPVGMGGYYGPTTGNDWQSLIYGLRNLYNMGRYPGPTTYYDPTYGFVYSPFGTVGMGGNYGTAYSYAPAYTPPGAETLGGAATPNAPTVRETTRAGRYLPAQHTAAGYTSTAPAQYRSSMYQEAAQQPTYGGENFGIFTPEQWNAMTRNISPYTGRVQGPMNYAVGPDGRLQLQWVGYPVIDYGLSFENLYRAKNTGQTGALNKYGQPIGTPAPVIPKGVSKFNAFAHGFTGTPGQRTGPHQYAAPTTPTNVTGGYHPGTPALYGITAQWNP